MAPRPTDDELAQVLGAPYLHSARDVQAGQLVARLARRGVRLAPSPDKALLLPTFDLGRQDELTEADRRVIRWLKPDVLAHFQVEEDREERHRAAEPSPHPNRAAPVPEGAARAIRARIANLTSAPSADDSDCAALADELCRAFREKDRTRSLTTYAGLARDVKLGNLVPILLLDSFEDACGAKVRNRGAAFVDAVKRRKSLL